MAPVDPLPQHEQGFDIVKHVQGWWHVYGAGITTAAVALLPQAQQIVATHPRISSALATIAVVAAKLSRSPRES